MVDFLVKKGTLKCDFAQRHSPSQSAPTIPVLKTTLQTRSLYRLQGSPCVLILPCKDPVKITGYHSNPSKSVVRTFKNCNQYREIPVL